MWVGDVVADRFVIERPAGSGGMGWVFRALDQLSGGRVALKVMDGGATDSERFKREARMLAELEHPAIVRYVAHGVTDDGQPFLAMEWLDGEDLATRLARKPLAFEDAVALARRVSEGLAAAHGRGIVHRDIKPANLFLVDDDPRRAKIIDFGIARGGLPAEHAAPHTRSGVVLGTVGYMSPEQATGSRDVDTRSDVFALGCVLFFCLTGQPAFAGAHPVAVLAKVLHEEPPRPSELRPGLPATLDELLTRMLAKDADRRPASGVELVSALRELEGLGVTLPSLGAEPARALTTNEQRLACVIIGRPLPDALKAWEQEPSERARRHEAIEAVVRRFGASVSLMADASVVITLAGAEAAHDQVAQAARCAMSLAAAFPALRLALATGRADLAGRWPVGVAIDRAASLIEAPADLGAITVLHRGVAVDDVTSALLDARFEVHTLGTLHVLVSEQAADRVRTLLGRSTPCVGRDKEIALLVATFAEASSEPVSRVTLVTAPAGVGKSRLRHELAARLPAGTTVLVARGTQASAGSSLALVRQLVRRAAAVSEGMPPREQFRGVSAYLGRHFSGNEHVEMCEFIGELVGAPTTERASGALQAARNEPRILAERLRVAFEDWLSAECRAGPLLLVLDDLHWGDAASVAYLEGALSRLREAPLMVLLLARPEVAESLPRLFSAAEVQHLRLAGLTRRASAELARAVLGERAEPEVVSRIVARAAGNAFYLEELIRHVAEGGAPDLPETVLAMAQSRLEALDPAERRLLRAASIFGDSFWAGGVCALVGGSLAPAEIEAWEELVVRRELAVAATDTRFENERQYVFRHALLREAAYSTLTDADRVTGHLLAAEWLERAGESDARAVADHFERGGAPERAVAWLVRAALAAVDGADLDAAVKLCERGLACGASGEALGQFLLVQARVVSWQNDWTRATELGLRALRLLPPASIPWCLAAGVVLFGATLIGDPSALPEVMSALEGLEAMPEPSGPYGLAMYQTIGALGWLGQRERVEALRARLDLAQSSGKVSDPAFAGWVRIADWSIALMGDDVAALLGAAEDAAARFREAGDRLALGTALGCHGVALSSAGALDAAEAVLREGLELGERISSERVRSSCLVMLAHVWLVNGRSDEALAAALEVASTKNFFNSSFATIVAALAELRLQRTSEARARIQALLERVVVLPGQHGAALAALAQIELTAGDHNSAVAAAERALDLGDRAGTFTYFRSLARLVRAEALFSLGDGASAERALREARDRLRAVASLLEPYGYAESFVNGLPHHARTFELARLHLDAAPRRL
jgi:eukaryotic-like serine/threonine-protein kinase